MISKKVIPIVALLLACSSQVLAEAPKITDFQFGKMKAHDEGDWYVYEETLSLPMVIGERLKGKDKEATNQWGPCFTYVGFDPTQLSYYRMTPPKPIQCYKFNEEVPCPKGVDNSIFYKVAMRPEGGDLCLPRFFTEGDPTGEWRFEIMISNEIVKKWRVNVIEDDVR